jgi:hypothetical protein
VQEIAVTSTERFVRVGRKQALNASRPEDADTAPFVVEAGDSYHVNIAISTGSGSIHIGEPRPTSTAPPPHHGKWVRVLPR